MFKREHNMMAKQNGPTRPGNFQAPGTPTKYNKLQLDILAKVLYVKELPEKSVLGK